MPLEIERKYLVTSPFKHLAQSSSRILQGYISSQRGRTVRVRLRDVYDADGRIVSERAYLTIKGPSHAGGLSRYEFEKEITRDEALSLLTLCEPGVVDKVRWLVPYEGHTFEVDEFHGDNEGLIVAEVELQSEEEAVLLPPFIGREVTGQRPYYNSCLRQHPYKDWTTAERNA